MKTAEIEINAMLHVKMNSKELKAFKLKCVREDREMSELVRGWIREYIARKKTTETTEAFDE